MRLSLALTIALSLPLAGCFTTERNDSLVDDVTADLVPVRFRHEIEVTDRATGAPLADATVYVANDEDPVVEVAWTDAAGRAELVEEYLQDTVRIRTIRVLGIPFGRNAEVRYPGFDVLVARAGYLPFETPFGDLGYGPRPGTPEPTLRRAPLVIERASPRGVSLPAAPAAGHPGRRAAALFAAAHLATVKLGVRGAVNEGRFFRIGAPGEAAVLSCAAHALRGRAGEDVLLVCNCPGAPARFVERARELLATCDGEVAAPAPDGEAAPPKKRRTDAAAFVDKLEAAPQDERVIARIAEEIETAAKPGKCVGAWLPPATAAYVARALGARGYRKIAETWIEAW